MTRALLLLSLLAAAGCASGAGSSSDAAGGAGLGVVVDLRTGGLTEAQACAVGYDLARQIHRNVSLRRTVVVAPRRQTLCERHTLTYLRRAGFRVAMPGQAGAGLAIRIDRAGEGMVSAIAEIGGGLRVARLYRPVRTGVVPAGPFGVQRLAPDSYSIREGPVTGRALVAARPGGSVRPAGASNAMNPPGGRVGLAAERLPA